MLKIAISYSATEERWTLKGQLVWPWIVELRKNWMKAQRPVEGRTCVVVLDEVWKIDESGERILRIMCNQGAQLVWGNVELNRTFKRLTSIDERVRL
jgi:hypothetical protein